MEELIILTLASVLNLDTDTECESMAENIAENLDIMLFEIESALSAAGVPLEVIESTLSQLMQ